MLAFNSILFPQAQIHELKQSQNPSTNQLKTTLLDPSVNLLFEKMKSELGDTKEKLEQAQNDLSAWKFTSDRFVDMNYPFNQLLWHSSLLELTFLIPQEHMYFHLELAAVPFIRDFYKQFIFRSFGSRNNLDPLTTRFILKILEIFNKLGFREIDERCYCMIIICIMYFLGYQPPLLFTLVQSLTGGLADTL